METRVPPVAIVWIYLRGDTMVLKIYQQQHGVIITRRDVGQTGDKLTDMDVLAAIATLRRYRNRGPVEFSVCLRKHLKTVDAIGIIDGWKSFSLVG